MIWLIEISRISLEDQLPTKHYVIKHSLLLKLQNIVDVSMQLLKWFTNLLADKSSVKSEIMANQQLAETLHISQLLGNLKNLKYTLSLKTTFWVLIYDICS